jgi:hypothetical protein
MQELHKRAVAGLALAKQLETVGTADASLYVCALLILVFRILHP